MHRPRVRKAAVRADGAESYVDLGPGKRTWGMVVLCMNDLLKYDGTLTGSDGQTYRDALYASYMGSVGTTVNFTDPLGTGVAVHIDNYAETIMDLHTQQIAMATGGSPRMSYKGSLTLVE